MRILLVGLEGWLGSWTESTLRALMDMGHTVQVFHYQDMAFTLKNRIRRKLERLILGNRIWRSWQQERVQQRLVKAVDAFTPNLVLVLKGETLQRKTLETIKDRGTMLATWWVDDPFVFAEAVQAYSTYDAFFVFDQHYIARLQQLGIQHVAHLPNAYASDTFYPVTLSAREQRLYACDVAFVGSYYPPREQLFKSLSGKKIAIWGPGWNRKPQAREYIDINTTWKGRVLPPAESAKLYNAATICLNHHHHQIVFDGLNMRAFEIVACAGFEMTDYRPGFEAFFESNKEIVYYHSFEEIGHLVNYYISHPEERARIARSGYERATKAGSFHHRMEQVIRWATGQLVPSIQLGS